MPTSHHEKDGNRFALPSMVDPICWGTVPTLAEASSGGISTEFSEC